MSRITVLGQAILIQPQIDVQHTIKGKIHKSKQAIMADGYDPQKSRVAEDTLADFLRAPLTGDLLEVPGIGNAAVAKLASPESGESVKNTFQLIGKFLLLKASEGELVV